MSLFRVLGDARYVPLGVYDEYFNDPGVVTTNVYTVFRGLITDFGIAGSIIFLVVGGYLANGAYHRLVVRRNTSFYAAAYVMIVFTMYISFVISIGLWNGPFLELGLIYLALAANKNLLSRRHNSTSRAITIRERVS